MRLIFLSTALSDENYKRLIENCDSGAPTYSGIGFDYRIWKAMSDIYDDSVAFTYIPVPKTFSFDSVDFDEQDTQVIKYNNKSILKEWSFIHSVEERVDDLVKNSVEEICILLSGLYRVFVFAALRIKRKYSNVTVVGIVPDLPELMSNYYGKGNFVHQLKMKIDSLYGKKEKRSLDGYIFLSAAMNSIININHKPYAIMEGLIDDFELDTPVHKSNPKTVVYAGKIGRRFGVVELVKAFQFASVDNCILHIYGDGDALEEVKRMASGCVNIIIHGMQPHDQVVEAEKSATLLVEPRNPNQDFCSYCFPSKVLEYMSTGTPLIMAPLPNMDKKFLPLFVPILNYSVEELGRVIRDTLLDDTGNREKIGKDARLFIKENMTSSAQARVINDVITKSISIKNKTT